MSEHKAIYEWLVEYVDKGFVEMDSYYNLNHVSLKSRILEMRGIDGLTFFIPWKMIRSLSIRLAEPTDTIHLIEPSDVD